MERTRPRLKTRRGVGGGPELDVVAHAAEGEQQVAARLGQHEAEAARHQRLVPLGLVQPQPDQVLGQRRGRVLLKAAAVQGMLGRVHGVAGVGVEQQEVAVDAIVAQR